MEPAFQRGDILFLNNAVEEVNIGDVVVFKIRDRDIPIVHRILKKHEKPNGHVELLTKGDNNRVDDRGLYAPGQLWLEREDILGKAVGTLRYVGMVTIALNDYPVLKYVLVGMMGLFVLTSKEGWQSEPITLRDKSDYPFRLSTGDANALETHAPSWKSLRVTKDLKSTLQI